MNWKRLTLTENSYNSHVGKKLIEAQKRIAEKKRLLKKQKKYGRKKLKEAKISTKETIILNGFKDAEETPFENKNGQKAKYLKKDKMRKYQNS